MLVVVAAGLAIGGPFLERPILLIDAPFGLVNVLAGLVYAVAMPFCRHRDNLRLLRHARTRAPGRDCPLRPRSCRRRSDEF